MVLGGSSTVRADYRNPRLTGLQSWQPAFLRTDESLVSLGEVRNPGRLSGSDKVREDVHVDPERGVVVATRRYGDVLLAPEYVEDLETAGRASARAAQWRTWRDRVESRSLKPPRGPGDDILEIDIPVQFPDAVSNIIGQGARLNLRGSERITFSGTSTIRDGGPQFESGDPSIFPDLDMRQQLKVNLDGTIGEKIHVLVNHDSEVDQELENKIQLRYDGDDDEVIQKIEMGNTDLSLPGSEFLSFRKSQQGLFGAKAIAKLGALDLTIIASKQEGKTATQNFVGQARRDSVVIRDWEFVKRTYYWVQDPVALVTDPGLLPLGDFELFLDDKRPQNDIADGAKLGFAYVDPAGGTPTDSLGVVRGSYHRLDENIDYTIDRQTGVLTLERPVGREEVMALAFVRADGSPIGNVFAAPDTLSLQLLAPPELELYDDSRGFTPLRIQEQKNVYSFNARNIDPASFEMRILKKASAAGVQDDDAQATGTGTDLEYVRVLGLDYRGEQTADPDLRVEPQYVDFEDGTVTFPNITPFDPDASILPIPGGGQLALNVIVSPQTVSTGRTSLELAGPALAETNEQLYTREPNDLFNQEKYLLEIRFTTPTPSYNLNRFNILEGSETVRLNGRTLSRGVDYDIDYDFGILTFRTEEANAADAEIEVDFEFVPLFGQAKESLVGVSGTYNFGPQTRLSSSWLFFTRATPEERPRLGQEPSRILVGNLYGQWVANPDFLSDAVNALPLVRTEAASQVEVNGEVALSVPNPNTKDQIYIDDMEGVEDSRELSITRGVWVPGSEPAGPSAEGLDRTMIRPQPYNWYNPENTVRRRDVFIELEDEREGQEFLQVMEFRYRDEVSPDSTGWFGIMRNLSTIGEDFSEKKFLEVWVNDFGRSEGRMIVDMGEINEDFYVTPSTVFPEKGRGFLDTEDFDPYDGSLTVSKEDFGLDNVNGSDGAGVPGDDGDDDFAFSRTSTPDYSKINNYEDNSLLDTEDLDGDNLLDTDNAYFSYVFDLANRNAGQGYVAQANFDASSRPNNFWRLYRIRLDEGQAVGGVPRLRAVKYLRLWFDGISGGPGPKVQIASVKIVGSAWLEEKISTNLTVEPAPDSPLNGDFGINVLNNKEDADYFPPFDPGEDANNEVEREQTLTMVYAGIPSAPTDSTVMALGLQASAYKEILDSGQGKSNDYTQYETMSLYLRDGVFRRDGNPRGLYSTIPEYSDGSKGTFFLRFGPDTTNFYEFSTTRLPGQGIDSGWREVSIDLDELTQLKLEPAQGTRIVEGVEVDYRSAVVDGDTLAVYGAPSMARVRRMTIGVRGDDAARNEIFGEIWVNDIRLQTVRKEVGYASRITGSAQLADFASVSGNARKIDSEFRRIEGDRHGTNEESWGVRGDVNVNKFFDGHGISLPLSADYTTSQSIPRLAPNSDIVLEDEEDKDNAKTVTTRRTLSSRFAKTRASGWSLLRYTVDNMTFTASNTTTDTRTPFQTTATEGTSASATYNLNPGQGRSYRFLKMDLSYAPTLKFRLNGSLNQTLSADAELTPGGDRLEQPRDPVRVRDLRGEMDVQWDPVRTNSFDTSFLFKKAQDLDTHKEDALWDSFTQGGRELRRQHSSRVSYRPPYVKWLRPVLSYDTSYNEDQGPGVQEADLQDSLRVFRVENSNTREITTTLSFRQMLKRVDREDEGGRARAGNPGRGRGRPAVNRGGSVNPDRADSTAATPDDPGEDGTSAGDGDGDADTEDGDGEGDGSGWSIPGPLDIYDRFVWMTHLIGDIRYTYTDRTSSRFSRVRDRPGFGYQFGLEDFDLALIVPRTATTLIEDNSADTYTSRLDTSFQPVSSMFLSVGWNRTLNRRVQAASRNKTDEMTWPDLSLNIDGLERRRPFSEWTKTSSLSSSYRRSTSRSGKLPPPNMPADPARPWYDNESVREEFSPLASWTAGWKSGVNTTVSHSRSTNTDETVTTFSDSKTVTTAKSYRISGRYGFSAPNGISLFGKRLRFRSDLTLNLDLERSEQKSVESNLSVTTTRRHEKNLSVKPRATYNFSRKIQGSLDMSYARSKDVTRDITETVVSVSLEALIKF